MLTKEDKILVKVGLLRQEKRCGMKNYLLNSSINTGHSQQLHMKCLYEIDDNGTVDRQLDSETKQKVI